MYVWRKIQNTSLKSPDNSKASKFIAIVQSIWISWSNKQGQKRHKHMLTSKKIKKEHPPSLFSTMPFKRRKFSEIFLKNVAAKQYWANIFCISCIMSIIYNNDMNYFPNIGMFKFCQHCFIILKKYFDVSIIKFQMASISALFAFHWKCSRWNAAISTVVAFYWKKFQYKNNI